MPPAELLPQRLAAVLAVLYLIFNEGYDEQDHHRGLTAEAIRLARVLVRLMPAKPEPRGLLALMLLHESRRATRTDAGVLVTLEHQNRSRWDRALIAEGVHTLNAALAMQATGPYQVQAAIAACHATATDTASTDWAQIAALYTQLARLAPSPVVDLNRAVAVAMAHGIPAGPGPGRRARVVRPAQRISPSARDQSRPAATRRPRRRSPGGLRASPDVGPD